MTVSLQNVSFSVAGKRIVQNVSFDAPERRVIGIIGPNGSGKSTLLRLVSGLLEPDEGRILFAGEEIRRLPRKSRAKTIAHIAQEVHSEFMLTAYQTVSLGRIPHQSILGGESAEDVEAIISSMQTSGVLELQNRLMNTLSGGEQKRVHIARGLAQDPVLLLADEPTNHLDITHQLELLATFRTLAESGITAVVATHDLNLALNYCDYIVAMKGGEVVASGPTEEALTAELVSDIYGVRAELIKHGAQSVIVYNLKDS